MTLSPEQIPKRDANPDIAETTHDLKALHAQPDATVPEENRDDKLGRFKTPEAKRKMKRNVKIIAGLGIASIFLPVGVALGLKTANSPDNAGPDRTPDSNSGPAVAGTGEQGSVNPDTTDIIYEFADPATNAPELSDATFNEPGWTVENYPYRFAGMQTDGVSKEVSRDQLKEYLTVTTEQAPTAEDAFRFRFASPSLQGLMSTGFNAQENQSISDNGFMPFQDMPLNPGQAARGMYDPTIVESIAAKNTGTGAGGETVQLLFGNLSVTNPSSANVVESERDYYKNIHEQGLYYYGASQNDDAESDYSLTIGSDITSQDSPAAAEKGTQGKDGYVAEKVITITLQDNGDLVPELAKSRTDAGLQPNMLTTLTVDVKMIVVDGTWLIASSDVIDVQSNND